MLRITEEKLQSRSRIQAWQNVQLFVRHNLASNNFFFHKYLVGNLVYTNERKLQNDWLLKQ